MALHIFILSLSSGTTKLHSSCRSSVGHKRSYLNYGVSLTFQRGCMGTHAQTQFTLNSTAYKPIQNVVVPCSNLTLCSIRRMNGSMFQILNDDI